MNHESTTNPYLDLARLHEEAAASYPSNQLYCLVDHAGMPGLHRQLLRSQVRWISLFEGSKEEAALEVAPLLFALDGDAAQPVAHLRKWVSEHGTYTSSLLLLSSPLAIDALGNALAQRTQAKVSEDMDVLLRYFDPRVFEALMEVLTPGQRQAYLGVADCWWYPNRRGELVRQAVVFEPTDTFEAPLVMSAEQEFALLDLSEIDQVASQLEGLLPEQYMQLGLARRHDFLLRHINDAKAAGIDATHELSIYCGLALLHGDDFAAFPVWQTLMADVRDKKISFIDAVAAVDE